MLTINRLVARSMAETLGADSVTLDGAKLRLLTGAVTVTPATEWTDLTEATFEGYAASATISWDAATIDTAGNGQVTAPTITFLADDTITTSNTITGLAYTQGSATITLVAAEALETPIAVRAAGDFVRVDPLFSMPGGVTTHVEGPGGTVQG